MRTLYFRPVVCFLLAALRAAQSCRYFVYSEADFEVFRPAGATRCTDGCNDKGVGPPKLKFLLRFDRNLEYKRPAGGVSLAQFSKKIAEFLPHLRLRWV